MKRLMTVLFFALVVLACASSQTVYYKDRATLQWDAVTVDAAGDPFLPTDVVEYEIYIYDHVVGVTNPQDVSQLTLIGTTPATQQLIVFPYRTSWVAGGRTKVTDAGGNVEYSPLAWSDVPTDAGPAGPFLYVPLPTLRAPLNLRDSGM
jgi:hypothetical protein